MKSKRRSPDVRRTDRPVDIGKAIALHRAGKLLEAKRVYQAILAADPADAVALHFLGVLHHQSGQSDRAVASIERAIAVTPDYADAHNNLGNVFKETNQLEAAFRAYRRVVELIPNHADAWNNLGVVLRGQRQYEAADKAYARALASNPAHAAAWHNRASLFARMNRLGDAIAAYSRALELQPRDAATYEALSRTLYRARRIEQAIAVYHQWLHADPGNSVAKHMLAACTGEAAPARASDQYVKETFDAFAASFDQVLDHLEYRAPAVIAQFLDRILPAPDASLAVADAGCGTGLCADFLRPRAKRLVGVDLSKGMLTKARARQKYDLLVEAELSGWLAAQRHAYHLIVCADTLCYFGALDGVLAAAERALQPDGVLVFTLETAADVPEYQLNPTGRYSHAEQYVRDRLAAAALGLVGIEQVVLRRESGQEVRGLLVGARCPLLPAQR